MLCVRSQVRISSEVWITYVHRGASGDQMTIPGSDVVELEHSFFVTNEAKIPYHRIKLIPYRKEVLFDLQKASSKEKE